MTWKDKTCGKCFAWCPGAHVAGDTFDGECRLNPPIPISAHAAEYPKVRSIREACQNWRHCMATDQQDVPSELLGMDSVELIDGTPKCTAHPRFTGTGKQKPRTACPSCQAIWSYNNGKN